MVEFVGVAAGGFDVSCALRGRGMAGVLLARASGAGVRAEHFGEVSEWVGSRLIER
jgi:hypothetical protein